MKNLGALQQSWFVACVVGAAVAPIVPPFLTSGVILLGLILLVAEKDRRYPQLTWPASRRAFVDGHRWSQVFLTAAMGLVVYGLSLALSQNARGIYLMCLGVYAVIYLGVPVRAHNSDAPVGS